MHRQRSTWALVLVAALSVVLCADAAAQQILYDENQYGKINKVARQGAGVTDYEAVMESSPNFELLARFAKEEPVYAQSKPVGLLDLLVPGKGNGVCTASVVSDKLILTNFHCVPGLEAKPTEATLVMGLYDQVGSGVKTYRVDVIPLEAKRDLDYALLRVEGNPAAAWGTISLDVRDPSPQRALTVIHHPAGLPKRVTRANCFAASPTAINGDVLFHTCDTLPGSSGAPIFLDGKVLALHFGGPRILGPGMYNSAKRMTALVAASPILRSLAARTEPAKTEPAASSPTVPGPSGPKVGSQFRDCTACPLMVVVPAGSFLMGSPASEPERESDEGPQHQVTIPASFAVGVFEVTWAEWEACAAARACNNSAVDGAGGDQGWGKGNRPVINVSWNDAQAYAAWLSDKTGKRYRLLSEAEWEYVARAGTTTPFNTGDRITTDQANFNGNYTSNGSAKGVYRQKTVPVGSFSPNRFGLHDVHGNVWEWVEDCYNASYGGAPIDGSAWLIGDCSERVLRGGSWSNDPRYLRSAARYWDTPTDRDSDLGFRLARTLQPGEG